MSNLGKNYAFWTLVFVIGAVIILTVSGREEQTTREVGPVPIIQEARPEPVQHSPVRRTFTGTGTDITPTFSLRSGTALFQVEYTWSSESEYFGATIESLSGNHVRNGLLVNETSDSSRHIPVSVRRLVRVENGEYVVQVRADRGNTWHVTVTQ